MKGWKVVVVADKKTPNNWEVDSIEYLSVNTQYEMASMGLKLPQILPWNSYTRKNIGYLYAILNGAQFIYETDDDNHPDDDLSILFDMKPINIWELKQDCALKFANVYSYFGIENIWPRGFPIQHISEAKECYFQISNKKFIVPIIQQGLVNGDPDVDAIYRLVNKKYGEEIKLYFSNKDKVIMPHKNYCPYNSQNTLSLRKAFWGLYLYSTVNLRITDIWRGYVVQRVLRDIGEFLAFYPPNAFQKRSAHDYLKDFIDEKMLYTDVQKLVNVLDNWKSTSDKLSDRLIDLLGTMIDHNLLEPKELEYYEAWLHDLELIGYKYPNVVK